MDATPDLPSLATVLSSTEITSTEDLTRALRAASLPLQHRLTLAWAILDSSTTGSNAGPIQRLSAILVRKNELLIEWVLSTIRRELKVAKPDEYALFRDPAAILLLTRILEGINESLPSGTRLDVHTVLDGPFTALFVSAFSRELTTCDLSYIVAVTKLWRFIIECTADGLEAVSTQFEGLVQLLGLVTAKYLKAADENDEQLRDSLLGMLASVFYAMRNACESTLAPRRSFDLFDKVMLPQILRLTAMVPEHGDVHGKALDMLHAGLFHIDPMRKFMTELLDRAQQRPTEYLATYTLSFFGIVSGALELPDVALRAQYAAALPNLLARFLQASALLCNETRSQATITIGLASVAASPVNRPREEVSSACLAMFSYFYNLLQPLSTDERFLAATNRLVAVYFGDPLFGTVRNSSIASGDIYQSQMAMLDGWLGKIVSPIFSDPKATASSIGLALDGIDTALEAGPDSVQAHASQFLDAFSHIPVDVAEPAGEVLKHLVSTLAKARQLDTLFEKLVKVRVKRSSRGSKHVNLLVSVQFIRAANQAISQSMPFAQATACVSTVIGAVVAEALKLAETGDGNESRKRRRTSHGSKASSDSETSTQRLEMLATIAANVVLASATTVGTEQQREQYFQLLTVKYEETCTVLSGDGAMWERLLLHYSFMEVASRIDGTERWLEKCMYPGHVCKNILPSAIGSKSRDACSAPVSVLVMLVTFQTAAHWSVFVSSIGAGIIPQSALEFANVEEATVVVKEMVAAIFSGPDFCIAPADDGLAGWDAWDGQAHSISAANSKSAQWRLLADWLELACEYVDSCAIDAIASRIVSELASPASHSTETQALLCSAGFFEVARIRDALAPALAGFAAATLRQQIGQHKSSSSKKPSALRSGVLEVADWLNASAQKKGSSKAMMDVVMDKLGSQDLAPVKRKLKANQACTWIQLLRGLLCFPVAYWSTERAHVVLAVALTVDLGIAPMCEDEDDALSLRIHSRAAIERLLRCLPSASAGLVQHTQAIVDHLSATARLSEQLILPSRRLVRLAVSALAQAAFGQSMDTASATCRELCTRLYTSISSDSATSASDNVLALDSLGAVAKAAATYAQKLQARGKDKEWCSLVKSLLKRIAQQVCSDFDCLGQSGEDGSSLSSDTRSTCRLGALVSLSSLYKSLAGANKAPFYVVDLARRAADSLPLLSQSSSTFALGLVLLHVHNCETAASAGCHITLAYLAHQLAAVSARDVKDDSMPLALQSLVASIACADSDATAAMPLTDAIVSYAVEPLLRSLDHTLFAASLDTFLKLMLRSGQRTMASVGSMLLAYICTAYKQIGNASAVAKRKAVQRRLGSILTTLHMAMRAHQSADTIKSVLSIVSELVLEPAMHFTMLDVSEVLSIIFTAVTLPLPSARVGADLPGLYRSACKLLGAVVRHHTNAVLDSVSVTVALLRVLLHAFVTPSFPRASLAATTRQSFEIDCSQTPWIVAYAPLPISCAESYSRVLAELANCRRSMTTGSADKEGRSGKASSKQTSDKATRSGSEYVKLTRGTNTAGATSVLSMYVSYIIAEYCIIQGGGALSTLSYKHSNHLLGSNSEVSGAYSFQGLSWRPAPVMRLVNAAASAALANGDVGMRGTISTPLLREALLPGWHALLDILGGDDRTTLLALLAGSSGDSRQSSYGWTSIFGPDRYGGAHEVLKSLYQNYLDYYKYKGQV
ncbi:hypothetical protein GGI20_001243 [Coemansia sp. BCRC 34301]|nr:hypothetical protein GGI20_001243 [Coemansia sp. BCRC 34301]